MFKHEKNDGASGTARFGNLLVLLKCENVCLDPMYSVTTNDLS